MQVLVTGVAGFIGSWIAETLLKQGHDVLGVDCFTEYYSRHIKESNLSTLRAWKSFRFEESDLAAVEAATLRRWFEEYPYVTHQAAQAGVRASWGSQFEIYTRCNITVTQRMLEVAKDVPLKRFVYASTSSAYGAVDKFPLREDGPTLPVSPYGVTKLAAEHLTRLYHHNFGVPTVALRYFTVYGPRQRPDMAFNRLIRSLLTDEEFPLYGDGTQSRNFTYVDDVVQANLAGLSSGTERDTRPPFLGQSINIGGGARVSMNEVIALAEELIGKKARINRLPVQKGDVDRTEADLTRARRWLAYEPRTDLRAGLEAEINWMRQVIKN